MGFAARSLDTISKAIRGDLRREMPGTDATVWPNTLAVFSKVVAMAAHLVELRMAWIYSQIFASTATVEHLERHAYEYGLARKGASRSAGTISTSGAANAVYPAGIAYLSGSDIFVTAGDARVDGSGNVTLPVMSQAAGASQNRDAGDTLTLADPALYPTLAAQGTVDAGGLGGGADIEDDESLRARVLDRKRRPPQGGAESDYEQFAMAVPGVKKAWAHRFANGDGTVGIWVLFEGRENFIPTDADIAAVQAEIDLRRMIRVSAIVSAPIPYPVNITISGLSQDSASTRAAIAASLAAMFDERCEPGVAVQPFWLSRSWISQAISEAIGEDRHVLVTPAVDIMLQDGEIPVVGEISYE